MGTSYILAIKQDGTLWSRGCSFDGSLGLDDTDNKHIPTLVTNNKDLRWLSIKFNYLLGHNEDRIILEWRRIPDSSATEVHDTIPAIVR